MVGTIQTYSNIGKEIDSVQQFLENEAYRYEGKLTWTCSIDPDVNTEQVIPKMLILTFVEHAISHGLFLNKEGGKVEVSVHKTELGILVMVTDNGANLEEAPSIHQHRKEKLRCLDEYLKLFSEKLSCTIGYHILNRSLGENGKSGSRVLITIQHQ